MRENIGLSSPIAQIADFVKANPVIRESHQVQFSNKLVCYWEILVFFSNEMIKVYLF